MLMILSLWAIIFRLFDLVQKDEEQMKELRSKIAQLEEINARIIKVCLL